MISYKNLKGNSNVKCYNISENYIDIEFYNTPLVYRYSNVVPGRQVLNELKRLAIQGHGLNSYINKYVKENYETLKIDEYEIDINGISFSTKEGLINLSEIIKNIIG